MVGAMGCVVKLGAWEGVAAEAAEAEPVPALLMAATVTV